MRKVYRGIAWDTVEKKFVGDTMSTPKGWHDNVKEAKLIYAAEHPDEEIVPEPEPLTEEQQKLVDAMVAQGSGVPNNPAGGVVQKPKPTKA